MDQERGNLPSPPLENEKKQEQKNEIDSMACSSRAQEASDLRPRETDRDIASKDTSTESSDPDQRLSVAGTSSVQASTNTANNFGVEETKRKMLLKKKERN